MNYKYTPTSKAELKKAINKEIDIQGTKADLNCIDTSLVTDMSYMFFHTKFNGDISGWDVSNVTDMGFMFKSSVFNGDISEWNVSGVTKMDSMFNESKFNGDISKWDVSRVVDMCCMFFASEFNNNISNWDVSVNCNIEGMYDNCKIKPYFKHNYVDLGKNIDINDLY